MKTLFLLSKLYTLELFGINRKMHMPGKRTGKRMSAAAFVILALLAVIAALGLATFYCGIFAYVLNMVGMLHIYPILITVVCCLLSLLTTAARSSSVLMRTKDYDLVTSLPIPTRILAASRVLRLYIINLATDLLVALPAGACYAYFASPSFAFYPIYILCTLLTPLLPVAIGSVFGSLIATISAALGNNRYVKLALSFLFPLAIMACSFSLSYSMQTPEKLAQLLTSLGNTVSGLWPPAVLVGNACCKYDLGAFALYALLSIGSFALFCLLYGKLFVKLVTFTDSRRTKSQRVAISSQRGVFKALYSRDVKRYLGSTAYVMNTAFGMILSFIGVAALSFTGIDKLAVLMEMDGGQQYISAFLPFVLAWMSGMSVTTGTAISMEGKSLWIARSAPISAIQYLLSKLCLSFTVTLPFTLVNALILSLTLKLNIASAALLFFVPAFTAIFCSLIGLLGNIRFHRFDWSNETAVVKQSFGALIPVLTSMLISFVPCGIMGFLGASTFILVPCITLGAELLLSLIMLLLIKRFAERWVQAL